MDASPLFVALVLAGLVSLFVFVATTRWSRKPSHHGRRLPPSPSGLPLLGHLPLLGSLPHRKLQSLAEAHGPVILLRLGRVPTVVASSAAATEEAMKTRDLAFASRAPVRMAERLLYGRDMVFAPYGEFWRQARRVSVVHLLNYRRIHSSSFRRARAQEVAAVLDRIESINSTGAGGGVVNLSELLISYARGVISRAAFGDDYELDGEVGGAKLRELFAELEEMLGTGTVGEFVPWLAWVDTLVGLDAKATRTFQALDGLLERVLDDHISKRRRRDLRQVIGDNEDDQRDFVDVLLDVKEEEEEKGGGVVQFDTIAIKAIILDSWYVCSIFNDR